MVEFAGWELPVHYGSQLEEHRRVRREHGMFDVSHMRVIDVQGSGASALLRRVLANTVDKLRQAGDGLYSCMLNPDGGVLDDLIAFRIEEEDYRLIVNAGTAEQDIDWLSRQRAALPDAHPTLSPRRDLGMIAVQGPCAREAVWRALPGSLFATERLNRFQAAEFEDMTICRTGYTGEDGFELIVPGSRMTAVWEALSSAGVLPAGLGARDTLRLEAGMNLYGADMDASTHPYESNLGWTVDLTAGRDFVGRNALESCDRSKRLTGLILEGRGVLRHGMPVTTAQGDGLITSGSFSPTLNASIALARLPSAVSPGATVSITIRDLAQPARVTPLPFVRNGKILV